MYMHKPPKNSLPHLLTTLMPDEVQTQMSNVRNATHGQTCEATAQVFRREIDNDGPFTAASFALWMTALHGVGSASLRLREFSMSKSVCDLLSRAGDSDSVPYEDFSTESALTYIDISAAGFNLGVDPGVSRKVFGAIVMNMQLISGQIKSGFLRALHSRSAQLMERCESESARSSLTEVQEAVSQGYAIFVLHEDFGTVGCHLLISPSSIRSGRMRSELARLCQAFGGEHDAHAVVGAVGLILKSALFLKSGDFTSRDVSFGRRPTPKSSPKRRKGPTPPQGGVFKVSYISEQSGGCGIPWLNTATPAEDVAAVEVDRCGGGGPRASRVIPDHVKLIWVTDEYVTRKGIPREDIVSSGEVPRRGRSGNLIVKQRHLIAKEFVYGHGVRVQTPAYETVRVGVRKMQSA
jgi:hypothetical protein